MEILLLTDLKVNEFPVIKERNLKKMWSSNSDRIDLQTIKSTNCSKYEKKILPDNQLLVCT
jgi:hypothetical protein